MLISERNFLERLASHIPGIAGYREREGRRETDRRLREWMAGRLDEAVAALGPVRNRLTGEGRLEVLNAVAELDRWLQKTASGLRFADAGYSGLFDQVKVREDELAAIYAFDLSLTESVEGLGTRLRALAAVADPGPHLEALVSEARTLDHLVERRRELFEKPEPAGPGRGE